jgi:transposase
MHELAENNIQTNPFDHHGIIAAVCKDLKIAERIDAVLGVHEKRIVTPGQAVVAMILNGLGFTDRRLYLTSQFFESKPVAMLLGADIKASDLNDYTLGHTLDQISDFGSSPLFASVAFGIAMENNLLGNLSHIDSTSISVSGEYGQNQADDGEPIAIQITHGHSKDHRPDLKQMMLSLVVNGPSHMPIWMEPQNGNSSDKKTFHETIKRVNAFKKQLDASTPFKWVADSALYSKNKLLASNDYLWLTRVPETIDEAKTLVMRPDEHIAWKAASDGYKTESHVSNYGGIEQRWLLVYSEKAYQKEKQTCEKNWIKMEAEVKKVIWHLGNEIFGCVQDAQSKGDELRKHYPDFLFDVQANPVMKYEGKGKPKEGEAPKVIGYKLEIIATLDEKKMEVRLQRKGRFILATNELNLDNYSDEQMLREYKEQQHVERGFRFLKDPWFMVDSIFLKSARRIEALMMVMTLCLLVYNIAQYRLRKKLKDEKLTLPNQLGKQVQNPTMKWIFQIMEGVGVVRFYESGNADPVKELVTNMNDLRQKIIRLFGPTACRMYGLIAKSGV